MKTPVVLCVLFVGSLAIHATEVEDLAPLPEDLGERAGGYFSALQTSGSFTMMQAGGFEKKEEQEAELGEATLTKRRDFIAAKMADKISQASGPQLDHLEKFLSAEEDLGQGTTTNAAACSGTNQGPYPPGAVQGSLDCSAANSGGRAGSECPDNLSMGKFWLVKAQTPLVSICSSFESSTALVGKTFISPAESERLKGVITKGKTWHPHLMSTKTGVLALKRMKCNSTSCIVFKTVVCAKCQTEVFSSTASQKATKAELKAWAKCIKDNAWNNAGTSTAQLKVAYRCDPADQELANSWAKAF